MPAILVFAVVLFGITILDKKAEEEFRAAQHLTAGEELSKVATDLESNIHGNVNLGYGLVASIATNPSITKAQFAAVADSIFSVPSQLRNVAAAPDLVVQFVYPEKGNEAVLGLDYTRQQQQSPAVMAAIKRRTLVINGPVKLVQGGLGLIARYPIFISGNGRFWGVLSAVIDIDKLYRDSNIGTQLQTLDIAISQRPFPAQKDILFGTLATFANDPVQARIELGYDTWYLAAVPKAGWQPRPHIGLFRLYSGLIAIGILVPLLLAGYLMRQRQQNIEVLKEREEELETAHHRLALALDASGFGVWEFEPASNSLTWDARVYELYQIAPDKRLDYSDWRNAIHPDDTVAVENLLQRSLNDNGQFVTQFRIVRPDGEIRHLRAQGTTYVSSTGVVRVTGANWDITNDVNLQNELMRARMQAEEQNDSLRLARSTLEYQSLHDALTGLPNRRYLEQFMDTVASTEDPTPCALIHFDLDRFKEVNDTLGHAAGDEVLRQATQRVQSLVDKTGFTARIGGDEFVVILSSPQADADARRLASSIVRSLAQPIMVDGNLCQIGCSAGIAGQGKNNVGLRQMLINADVALYEAKRRGRNRVETFSDSLLLTALETKRLSQDLAVALDRYDIIPYFQPLFEADSMRIAGVEALARWPHYERGLLLPAQFLSAAENLNRIDELDAMMLHKAHADFVRWQTRGIRIPHLSINVSRQRLLNRTLAGQLAKLPMPAGGLSFELEETTTFDKDCRDLKAVIRSLLDQGVTVDIDGFGLGHASMVDLLELEPKRLKLDQSLIRDLATSQSQRDLVASIVEIGRSQGTEIVAQGVETSAQVDILRDLGCHLLQGYFLARPMPADELALFAADWQAEHRLERPAARHAI